MDTSVHLLSLPRHNLYIAQGGITALPIDLLFFHIFSRLDFATLKYAGSVCPYWHGITKEFLNDFWCFMILKKYGQLAVEKLSKCHIKRWEKAFHYASLASFMNLQTYERRQIFKENYQIEIDANQNVKAHNTTTEKTFFLNGSNEQAFKALAYDLDFVFALRTDGKVIQWNFITDKIIQIFDLFAPQGSFDNIYIANGKLIASHTTDLTHFAFQIISYKNAQIESSFQYVRTSYILHIPQIIGTYEKNVFLKDNMSLKTFNIKSHQVSPFFFYAQEYRASIHKNFIIITCFSDRDILLYDASNLNYIDKFGIPKDCTAKLQLFVHHDFLIGFSACGDHKDLIIWNIKSKELVQNIHFESDPCQELITFLENSG